MVSAIPVRGYLRIQARGCPGGEISEGKGLKIRGGGIRFTHLMGTTGGNNDDLVFFSSYLPNR